MNKRLLLNFIIVIMISLCVSAQKTKVKLRNGATLIGKIVSLDPSSEIILNISGFETKINMGEVDTIENDDENDENCQVSSSLLSKEPLLIPIQESHQIVTHKGSIKIDKEGNQYVEVLSDDGQELTMQFKSEKGKELTITKPRKGLFYNRKEYILPEYVDINADIFTVTTIESEAFKPTPGYNNHIKNIIFPSTLKHIGVESFASNYKIKEILLNEGLENIGKRAFVECGIKQPETVTIKIPISVKSIGENAFLHVGPRTSPRDYFTGELVCMPAFITPRNCEHYGIDDSVVERILKEK